MIIPITMAALNAAPMVMKDRMDSKPIPVIPCTLKRKDTMIYFLPLKSVGYGTRQRNNSICH